MEAQKKKVLVCVPNEGWNHVQVTTALLRMATDTKGCAVQFNFECSQPSDNARNKAVRGFLKGDWDFLLFMDSDNPPYKDVNPLDLVKFDRDIMVLPTPIWKGHNIELGYPPVEWNVYDDHNNGDWQAHRRGAADLDQIDAGGTGCMLIARRVLEAVKPAFLRGLDDDGVVVQGSDLLFCRRARDQGFRAYVHWGYPCHHFKERDLLEINQTLHERDISQANRPNINTPEYWDEQWAKRKERVLPFYAAVADEARKRGRRILDVGCGRGDLLSLLGPEAEGIDFSKTAVDACLARGLKASVQDVTEWKYTIRFWQDKRWDAIVCTEVFEHLDGDQEIIKRLFYFTDCLIYSVPNNCMPPGMEREHRRVYTPRYIEQITPHLKSIKETGHWLVVVAEKETANATAV